jgi:hypothetical protein
MPALVKRVEGSSGMREKLFNTKCPLRLKKSRKDDLSSLLVMGL